MKDLMTNMDLEACRVRDGELASNVGDIWGAFVLRTRTGTPIMKIIASTGDLPEAQNWEHVSVSCPKSTPTWEQMCWVKDQFWGPEETVYQFHPPKSQYVNHHPYCLHLWRNTQFAVILPPSMLIGPTDEQVKTMHTKDKLALELNKCGLNVMALEAARGRYDDFLSDYSTPLLDLANHLADAGRVATDDNKKRINELRQRVINGDFDATAEESEAWAKSAEGQATFQQLYKR